METVLIKEGKRKPQEGNGSFSPRSKKAPVTIC